MKWHAFQAHGVEIVHEGTEENTGVCPWCDSQKLYINRLAGVYDCKKCGEKGNLSKFLGWVMEQYQKRIKEEPELLEKLAKNRSLPVEALEPWGFGHDGFRYQLPVRDAKGRVVDIRNYEFGSRLMSTSGCSVGLLGCDEINDKERRVWVAEGEWDKIALSWALTKSPSETGVVVGVPGANTFKREWASLFQGKDVTLAYDHDEPGVQGDKKARSLLSNVARSVRSVVWPEDYRDGYDVRDYVALRVKKASKIVAGLRAMVQTTGPALAASQPGGSQGQGPGPGASQPARGGGGPGDSPAEAGGGQGQGTGAAPLAPRAGLAVYRKWLKLPNDDPILFMFGVLFANRIDRADPIWSYMVGSPGGGKSELISSLVDVEGTYFLSSLTPRTLVSGAMGPGGDDPSLMPKLEGKTLIIKDMTSIMSLPEAARAEIMGTLRAAYDGTFVKPFGTGIMRTYKVSFGILAGVTQAIDTSRDLGLGERFLKFRLPTLTPEMRQEATMAAVMGSDQGGRRREELAAAADGMMRWQRSEVAPKLTGDQPQRIIALAWRTALLRAAVLRDRYRDQDVTTKPIIEEPTRLAIQLTKLARGVSWFLGERTVSETAMRVVEKVAHDTPPEREVLVASALRGGSTIKEISERVGLPQATVWRRLRDMMLVGIVTQTKVDRAGIWTFAKQYRHLFLEKADGRGRSHV